MTTSTDTLAAPRSLRARIIDAETFYGTDAIHHTAFTETGSTVKVGRSTWTMATDSKGAEIAVCCQGGRCYRFVTPLAA